MCWTGSAELKLERLITRDTYSSQPWFGLNGDDARQSSRDPIVFTLNSNCGSINRNTVLGPIGSFGSDRPQACHHHRRHDRPGRLQTQPQVRT